MIDRDVTSERGGAFLGEVYLRELGDIVMRHNILATLLARDWTQDERDNDHLASGYFGAVAGEVETSFFGTYKDMSSAYRRMAKHVIKPFVESQPESTRLKRLWSGHGPDPIRLATDEERDPASGLPFIIYMNAWIERVTNKATYDDPAKAIRKMEASTDESLHPILRAAMDAQIFLGAEKGMDFVTAHAKADHASTPNAHTAMRRGIDSKVLTHAFVLRSGRPVRGLPADMKYEEFVRTHASSDTSAEMILGQVADIGRGVDNSKQDAYERRVAKHLDVSFTALRLHKSQAELSTEISRLKKQGSHTAAELVATLKRADKYRIEDLRDVITKEIGQLSE